MNRSFSPSRLSRFAAAQQGQLTAIEVNPLLVRERGQGVVALDALIVTPEESHDNRASAR
jgi:acetate---CoA ligase (ADP-forming)